MKILILGSKGMLGMALGEVFSDLSPTLWDKEELDITDKKTINYKLQTTNFDVIINAAAFTDVDGAEDNPEIANKLNGEAVENLVSAANEIGATLVQYSTAYVFDGEKKEGYKEADLPNPKSVYGKSKLAGERAAAKAKKHYILRLHALFGEAGMGKKGFIEKIIQAALGKKVLTVVDEEEGSPTYALDLAKRTRYILENKLPFGIYHAANSGSATWYGMTKEIFRIEGIGIELIPVDAGEFARKASRPKYAILLNTKLPQERPWQEALQEYLQ